MTLWEDKRLDRTVLVTLLEDQRLDRTVLVTLWKTKDWTGLFW